MTEERFDRHLALRAMLWLGLLAGALLPRESIALVVALFLLLIVLLSIQDWRKVTTNDSENAE